MSFLGLDVGKKRIGMAIGSVIAEEFSTLTIKDPAKSFLDGKIGTNQAAQRLREIVESNRIEKIIIGNPINQDDSDTQMSRDIQLFSQKLMSSLDIPIEMTNESLTSYAAEEMLKEEGLSIKETKLRVDQTAAKLILQQYIEDHP
ncbi:MAG: Holliday junction resolvase RuvX [bacterium]|nr:Holliday junction resolvase RuvX [bacterium]